MASETGRFNYGWVVVGLAVVSVTAAVGARAAFAVFFLSMAQEYGWGRAVTSGAYSLNGLVYALGLPISGLLLDRFSPRAVFAVASVLLGLGIFLMSGVRSLLHLYLLFGLLAPAGGALLVMPGQSTVVTRWFVRGRGAAMGFASTGWGLGFLVMVPLADWLIRDLGWRQAYMALGLGILGVVGGLNLLFQRRPPPPRTPRARANPILPEQGQTARVDDAALPVLATASAASGVSWTFDRAIRSWPFWALFLGAVTGMYGGHMLLVHQVAVVAETAGNRAFASWIGGMAGLVSTVSLIACGAISDRLGREVTYNVGSLFLVVAFVLLIAYPTFPAPWVPYAYALTFGLGFGSRPSMYPVMAADRFEGRDQGKIFGSISVGFALAAMTGPWSAGVVYDRLADYRPVLALAAVLTVVSSVVIWSVRIRRPAPSLE
ncbi:MAG: MFS transporter [Deltaproteobacteria bacterium]|nr:MFS transporter [Deltaproteobacteria bacterium]